MRVFLSLLLLATLFSIAIASSSLEFSNPSLPKLSRTPSTSSSCTCTGGGNSTFNQTLADTLYWRLDSTNDPPTSSWNMNSKGFELLGNSTLSGVDYYMTEGRLGIDTIFYWNLSGTKTEVINFRPYTPDILFGADLDMQGFDILGITDLTILGNMGSDTITATSAQMDGLTIDTLGINMTGTDLYGTYNVNATNVNADCISSKEYINYADSAAPPNGFLPYSTAVTDLGRGYPVLYDMEITSITLSSTALVECIGSDATTNNSCKGQPTFNVSGAYSNPFNITLNAQKQKTISTSINLSLNDQILFRTFGATVANVSSFPLSNVIVQFEAKRRC